MNWRVIRVIDAVVGIPFLYLLLFFRKIFPIRHGSGNPTRVLLVKFWGIGNLFMLIPSVLALKRSFPDAKFDLLTLQTNAEAAEVLGVFDNILTIDTSGSSGFIRTCLKNYGRLKDADYGLIIDFEQFARFSAIICALVDRGRSVGFRTRDQRRHFLYSDPVDYDNTVHVTESFLSLVYRAGAERGQSIATDAFGTSEFRPGDRSILQELGFSETGTVIVIHPGTSENFSERRWPPEHYSRLIDLIHQRHDALILCTGLDDERSTVAGVLAGIKHPERVADLSGRLDFRGFFRLILASDLVISADTASVHVASAFGVPVVGLYGPNTPLLYGPWAKGGAAVYSALSCSPCITNFNAKINVCRHPDGKGACMKKIDPEEVFVKVEGLLAARRGDA